MFGELPPEFKSGGIYSPENIPLADTIPLERSVDSGILETAIHELHHVVVGRSKGNEIDSISVIPEGNTLGWTLFKGAVDATTAAAGSIDTIFGPASGFGGDLATIFAIDWINNRTPGASISSAQNEARNIISGFDPGFLAIAAEIIALKGFLTAEVFIEVLKRADYELAWQRAGLNLQEALENQGINFASEYEDHGYKPLRPKIPAAGTFSLIETFKDKIVTTIYEDGEMQYQTVVCPRCGVEGGGHLPNCEAVTARSVTPVPAFGEPTLTQPLSEIKLPEPLEGPKSFPTPEVIFSD